MARYEETPLLAPQYFEYRRRPYRDVIGAVLYIVLVLLSLAGGIYAAVKCNPEFRTSIVNLDDPSVCPYDANAISRKHEEPDFNPEYFMSSAGIWFAISCVTGLLLGAAFVYGVRKYPQTVVQAIVGIQIAVPLVLAFVGLADRKLAVGLSFLGLSLLLAVTFYLWRRQLELVGRLLAVSAKALAANPGLLLVALLLQLFLLLVTVGFAAFTGLALGNGRPAPNPERHGSAECLNPAGEEVQCCVWQVDQWAFGYISVAAVTYLWTLLLLNEIKRYVVAGTVAQWYFAALGASTKGSTLRSLRYALGPHFGSLAIASLVLTVAQYMRSALDSSRANGGGNFLTALCASCAAFFYSVIEGLTRFTTVRMAITGESFWEAGKRTVHMLQRNLLDTAGVWWFPSWILTTGAVCFSAGWGYLTFTFGYLWWRHYGGHKGGPAGDDPAYHSAIALAITSSLLCFMIVMFLNSVLLNIVDAVYICYAMDRDQRAVTRPEVHMVYSSLPTVKGGGIVENPDGTYTYAGGLATSPPAGYMPAPEQEV